MSETIAAAAIQCEGEVYSLPRPNRHHHILWRWAEVLAPQPQGAQLARARGVQGFVTSAGRFVERIEAGALAMEAGQLTKLKWPPQLYTEDLW